LGRSPLRARVLDAAGALAHDQGDYAAARTYLDESLALWRQAGDQPEATRGLATSLNNLANVLLDQGDPDGAVPRYEEALALYRAAGDTRGTAMILGNL